MGSSANMADSPEDHPMVRSERKRRAEATNEPLYSTERSVYTNGTGLVIGVPPIACKIHDIDEQDSKTVEIHQTGIWIPCETDD